MTSPAESTVLIRKLAFRPPNSWKGRPYGLIEVEFSLKRAADFYHSMDPIIQEPPKGLFEQISRGFMDIVGYRHVFQRGHVIFIPLPGDYSQYLESGTKIRERDNGWKVDLGCRARAEAWEKWLALGFVDKHSPLAVFVEKVQNKKLLAYRLIETKVSATDSSKFSHILSRA